MGAIMKLTFHRYKKWFSHSKVKTFSLLSALVLWFYVVTDDRFTHTVRVPLHLINQSRDRILKEPIPSNVRVLFEGSGRDLVNMSFEEKRIELNLHQITTYWVFPITVDMIKGIPSGMDVSPQRIIDPDSVIVVLDRFAEKKVPLVPDIELRPADGYIQVGDIHIQPDSIIVRGPASVVDTLSEVATVSEAYSSVIKAIRNQIYLKPPVSEAVEYSADRVQFSIDIQRIGEKLITEIPVLVTHVPSNIKVTVVPSTFSLKVQGGVNILSKLTRDDIVAIIDFRRRSQYRGKRNPTEIEVPEGLTFSDAKPKDFEIIVER